MNERFEKLVVEAFFDEATNGPDEKMYTLGERKMQLFAELIVRECLSNMENCDGDLDFAIWKTRQDFGVES